jgi:hypothetical protein
MNHKKLLFYLFIVVVFTLIQNSLFAQESTETIDMTDVLTIESPSPKLKAIHIQTHKGLPRFGEHNQYRFINKYGSLDLDRPKNTMIKEGFRNYANMIKMKYMATYFDDIDKNNITVMGHENRADKKDLHSSTAQIHLLKLTKLLVSKDSKPNYFWNIRDEFEAQEIYGAFATANLEDLRKWSSAFFENDSETGYFVSRHKFGSYDFDKSGFWVNLPPHNKYYDGLNLMDEAFFHKFLPEESFENNYLNSIETTFPKILLPMTADKAEDFLNTRDLSFSSKRPSEYIYSAIKVRIVYKELNTENITFPSPTFTYQFEDPIIEFFKDIELTKKIGEISLINPIYNK